MSDIDVLRAIPLFDGLGETQLGAIQRVVNRRFVAADTVILREGSRGNSLFILTSGSVEVTKRLGFAIENGVDEAKEKTLVQLTAPQFFGEMGLLDENTERSATITSRSDCDLLEITKADFDRLAESDHALGYRVIRNIAVVLSSRLRRTDRDVLKLTIALSLALGNR